MKKNGLIRKLIVSLTVILLIAGIGLFSAFQWIKLQLQPTYQGSIAFEIQKDTTLAQVAQKLESLGYVRNARVFTYYLRYKDVDRNIKAGEYKIEAYTSLDDLIKVLVTGQEKTYRFTVPEGFHHRQIANKLSAEGLMNAEEFKQWVHHPPDEILSKLPESIPENASLEGFLFPETYFIARPDAFRIIDLMTSQFSQIFTEEMLERSHELGFTLHEIITLASIIEREAQYYDELALVSSVFHNRLRDGWLLQACSTVEYVTEKEGYVLTLEELQIDSPYNTYMYSGLPKGPIANPGLSSIMAALYPDSSNYYFFVAKGDGTHAFSRTLEEHNRNVRRYIP